MSVLDKRRRRKSKDQSSRSSLTSRAAPLKIYKRSGREKRKRREKPRDSRSRLLSRPNARLISSSNVKKRKDLLNLGDNKMRLRLKQGLCARKRSRHRERSRLKPAHSRLNSRGSWQSNSRRRRLFKLRINL